MAMGGYRPGSGRKSKAVEYGMTRFLDRCFTIEQREKCLATLISIATNKTHKRCVDANKLLFAYVWGRPKEHVEVTATDSRDDQLEPARRAYILAALPDLAVRHPDWNEKQLQSEAEQRFEEWLSSLNLNLNPVMTETVQ